LRSPRNHIVFVFKVISFWVNPQIILINNESLWVNPRIIFYQQ